MYPDSFLANGLVVHEQRRRERRRMSLGMGSLGNIVVSLIVAGYEPEVFGMVV